MDFVRALRTGRERMEDRGSGWPRRANLAGEDFAARHSRPSPDLRLPRGFHGPGRRRNCRPATRYLRACRAYGVLQTGYLYLCWDLQPDPICQPCKYLRIPAGGTSDGGDASVDIRVRASGARAVM